MPNRSISNAFNRRTKAPSSSFDKADVAARVQIVTLKEYFEFTDTDGDHNRLAMDGSRPVWFEPSESGGWKLWAQGPFTLNLETGYLSCDVGNATMLPEDVARFLSSTDGLERQQELMDSTGSDRARGRRRAKRLQARIDQGTATSADQKQIKLGSTTSASSEVQGSVMRSDGYPDAVSFAVPESSTSNVGEVSGSSLHQVGSSSGRDAKSYQTMSQRRVDQSSRVTLVQKEGMELPVGVFYEEMSGDSYEVDITRMEQTHIESGRVRKVRLEKPSTWRFSKPGGGWGTYPRDVCIELNRVFLAHKYGIHQDVNSSLDRKEDTKVKPAPASCISPQGIQSSANEFAGHSIASMTASFISLPACSLSQESIVAAREIIFSSAEARRSETGSAASLLSMLASHQGLTCDVTHARHAGLVTGSMRLLRAVFASAPGLRLVGEDIFNKRYPKLRIQDEGRKNGIRCLLARGMVLGTNDRLPQSKLLRKIEMDAEPLWVERCLASIMHDYPMLPETIRTRILSWLGLDDEEKKAETDDEESC